MLFVSAILATRCDDDKVAPRPKDTRSIVVIYDNDVHCAIDGYAKMAGYRDAIVDADTAWVATVSAGDFLQGGAVGALSKGQYVIDVMKAVGYDAVTLGNHEFDYKVPQMRYLMNQLPAGSVTCCNFYNASHDSLYYKDYVIKQMGSRKVAFVGITTPGTMISEAPAFYAADGITKLYDLREADCVELVQHAVDQARAEGANFVILLAHLGEVHTGHTSIYTPTLLAKTHGIDAVLDGHTHSVIPQQSFPDINSSNVNETQTGTKFTHVGKLIITSDGKISTELVPMSEISQSNAKVSQAIDEAKGMVDDILKKEIGTNYSPDLMVEDANGKSMARYKSIPLGTLIAEAFRYTAGAEIGLINGGGVRTSLKQGVITYGSLFDILPFGNELMLISATGQQILDALETAVSHYPMLSGGFMQCSGMRYEFNPDNKPVLEFDAQTYVLTVHGTRRITKCEVLGPDGQYHPIDPAKTYKVSSTSYVMKEGKEILAFRQSEVLNKSVCVDLEALVNYIVSELNGIITAPDHHHESHAKASPEC